MIVLSQYIFLLISMRRVLTEYQRGFVGCEFGVSHLHYHNVWSLLTPALASSNLSILSSGESPQV